mmetsp:Transcript_2782/g.4339  ORF Transcript_2782/g.4339 Transcript_2782/m.4339 type:complete len:219 (+) Transcript_2782:105-761(+)
MGKTGKLVFKGDAPKKSKKSKSKKSQKTENTAATKAASSVASSIPAKTPIHEASETNSITNAQPIQKRGTGTITSSGTTIMGHGTKFQKEMRTGDAIIITINSQPQMRVVKMLLSNISCSISSAFSDNLSQPTGFEYINAPRNEAEERRVKAHKANLEKAEDERVAFGTYAHGGNELVYREKSSTGTSYVIRRQELDREMSREELLLMRSKKKSDKYC